MNAPIWIWVLVAVCLIILIVSWLGGSVHIS